MVEAKKTSTLIKHYEKLILRNEEAYFKNGNSRAWLKELEEIETELKNRANVDLFTEPSSKLRTLLNAIERLPDEDEYENDEEKTIKDKFKLITSFFVHLNIDLRLPDNENNMVKWMFTYMSPKYQTRLISMIKQKSPDFLETFRFKNGDTLLYFALKERKTALVRYLLKEMKASISKGSNGENIFHTFASKMEDIDMFSNLIKIFGKCWGWIITLLTGKNKGNKFPFVLAVDVCNFKFISALGDLSEKNMLRLEMIPVQQKGEKVITLRKSGHWLSRRVAKLEATMELKGTKTLEALLRYNYLNKKEAKKLLDKAHENMQELLMNSISPSEEFKEPSESGINVKPLINSEPSGKHCGKFTKFQSCLDEYLQKSWRLEIKTLDVGQGDAKLVLFEAFDFNLGKYQIAKAILIDAGDTWYGKKLHEFLSRKLDKGKKKLDAVVLTHFDKDHTDGLSEIKDDFLDPNKTKFFTPDCESKDLEKLESFTTEKKNIISGEKILKKESIWEFLVGFPKPLFAPDITFVAVDKSFKNLQSGNIQKVVCDDSKNNTSVVSLISLGEQKYLTCGDRSYKSLKHIITNSGIKKVDVFQLPHHGSGKQYFDTDKFFEEINAEIALISTGDKHGHPHTNVVAAVNEKMKFIYCTNNPARTQLKSINRSSEVESNILLVHKNLRAAGDHDLITTGSNLVEKKVYGDIKSTFKNKLKAATRIKTSYKTKNVKEILTIVKNEIEYKASKKDTTTWRNVDSVKTKTDEQMGTIRRVLGIARKTELKIPIFLNTWGDLIMSTSNTENGKEISNIPDENGEEVKSYNEQAIIDKSMESAFNSKKEEKRDHIPN